MKWYSKGLRFKCTECGKCCTGSPGYIWISDDEAKNIASHLNLPLKEFIMRYTKSKNGRLSLTERKNINGQDHDCVFLKEGMCSIYQVRPKQCQTYPFWSENVRTKAAWEETAKECEGISEDAPLVTSDKIDEILADED